MAERKLYVEFRDGVCCKFREPTPEELKEALLLEQERQTLVSQQEAIVKRLKEIRQHPSMVFYDEGGYPYDVRTFIASGRQELL
jgi:hypothetical protein